MPRWTLTDRRKELAMVHFKSQGTIEALACSPEFKCHADTLSKHLKANDFTPKQISRIGLSTLKQDMYNKIYDQENSKDSFAAGMKYLDRYDLDDAGSGAVEDRVSTEEANAIIINQLTVNMDS